MKTDSGLLLVGCGEMGVAYANILQAMAVPFDAIGRGTANCAAFAQKTGITPIPGGVEAAVARGTGKAAAAIVAVDVESLADVAMMLLRAGVRRILLEKPGGMAAEQIATVVAAAAQHGAEVYVAYNRRFYASTRKARQLIDEDGGATSLFFEFTEWSHTIEPLPLSAAVKSRWFLANSSHVCDLAFFLAGFPRSLSAWQSGKLSWHTEGSVFVGCGQTGSGALFAYHSNWESAGRWGVEICTAKRRLVLRPLETLTQQLRGQIAFSPVVLDDAIDKTFKPGLHAQVAAFLAGDSRHLLTIADQAVHVADVYDRMVRETTITAND